MTTEHKLLFGPSDIERIEFICKACGASLTLDPFKENHFVQRECPNCPSEWMIQQSVLDQSCMNLLKAIRTLAQMQKEANFHVRLCLRSDEPK